MQFPNASRDRFILAPSRSLIPRLKVLAARSDPAKSIRLSFPIRTFEVAFSFYSTVIYRTAWDLDEVSFAIVGSYVRFLLAAVIVPVISFGEVIKI